MNFPHSDNWNTWLKIRSEGKGSSRILLDFQKSNIILKSWNGCKNFEEVDSYQFWNSNIFAS